MASDASGEIKDDETETDDEVSPSPLDRIPPWALGIGFIIVMGLFAAVVVLRLTEEFDRSQKDAYNTVLAVLLGVVGTAFGVGIQSGKVKTAERDKKRAQKDRKQAEKQREDAKVESEMAKTANQRAKARVFKAVAAKQEEHRRGFVAGGGGGGGGGASDSLDVSDLLDEIESAFDGPN